MQVKKYTLRSYLCSALVKIGYADPAEIGVIADSLIYAETHGQSSQGVIKVLTPYLQPHPAASLVSIVKASNTVFLLDGGNRSSILAIWQAVQYAVELAKVHGTGIGLVSRVSSSSGCLGFFADYIARCNFEGQIIATTFPKIAAAGGTSPALGINTIAFGFPSDRDFPVVIDLTTAAIPLLQVVNHQRASEQLPSDSLAYNKEGQPTSDPGAVLEAGGVLRAFGGDSHKGAVLATALQFLGQVATGAKGNGADWGARVQVTRLPDWGGYRTLAGELVDRIHSSRPAGGVDQVRIPGERGKQIATVCEQSGMVDVSEDVYYDLLKFINSES